MTNDINISLEIDSACEKPQVIIKTDKKNELIDRMILALERCTKEEDHKVVLYDGDRMIIADEKDIVRIYTEQRKVVICTVSGVYESKLSLREFESGLDEKTFSRISRFEIVNLNRVKSFDLSLAGTIKVTFEDGSETYVARRFVSEISQKIKKKIDKGGRYE